MYFLKTYTLEPKGRGWDWREVGGWGGGGGGDGDGTGGGAKYKQKNTDLQSPPSFNDVFVCRICTLTIIVILRYSYCILINTPSAHMVHINLNILYTRVEHSPIENTIYSKYFMETQTTPTAMNSSGHDTHACTDTHTHSH